MNFLLSENQTNSIFQTPYLIKVLPVACIFCARGQLAYFVEGISRVVQALAMVWAWMSSGCPASPCQVWKLGREALIRAGSVPGIHIRRTGHHLGICGCRPSLAAALRSASNQPKQVKIVPLIEMIDNSLEV